MTSCSQFMDTLQEWVDREDVTVSESADALAKAQDALDQSENARLSLWQTIANVQSRSIESGETTVSNTRVERILGERAKEIAQLDEQRGFNREQISKHKKRLKEEKTRREYIAVDHQRAQFHFESGLERDGPYVALADEARSAQDEVNDMQRRLDEAVAERDEKIPDYEGDAVFMQLKSRGYNTANYKAPFGTRRLDHWLAVKLNYRKAVEGYKLLQEMPGWLTEHLQKSVDKASAAETERSRYELARRAEHDVSSIDQTLEDADNRVSKASRDVERLYELARTLDGDRALYGERRDKRSIEIRDVYQMMYGAKSIDELKTMARKTASNKDELAVAEIDKAEQEYKSSRQRLDSEQARHADISKRKERIDRVMKELRETGKMDSHHVVHQAKDQKAQVLLYIEGQGSQRLVCDSILEQVEAHGGKQPRGGTSKEVGAFPGA